MSKEIWIISVNKNYKVSSKGRVLSLFTDRIMRQQKTNGYPTVFLSNCSKMKKWRVSRLMLSSFDKEMPLSIHCRHIDDNRLNNNLSNLSWGTVKDNFNDRRTNGRYPSGENAPNLKLTKKKVLYIRKHFNKISAIMLSNKYNVSTGTIYDIIYRKTWKEI